MTRLSRWLFRRALRTLFPDRFAHRLPARRPSLTADPLESREPTGNLVNGLFVAALGGTMAEPLDALAAAVGDLALLGRPVTTLDTVTHFVSPASGAAAEFGLSESAPPPDEIPTAATEAPPAATEEGRRAFPLDEWVDEASGRPVVAAVAVPVVVRAVAPRADVPVEVSAGRSGLATPEPGDGPAPGGDAGFDWPPVSIRSPTNPPSAEPGTLEVVDLEGDGDPDGPPPPTAPLGATPTDPAFAPLVLAVAPDPTASEVGPGTGVVRISRVGPTTGALNVYFALGGTAEYDTDYKTPDPLPTEGGLRYVTIQPGERVATVRVEPVNDQVPEWTDGNPGETVELWLRPDPNDEKAYAIDRKLPAAGVFIGEDDRTVLPPGPLVWIDGIDLAAQEHDNNAEIDLRRATTVGPLTVRFRLDGTALDGEDYTVAPSDDLAPDDPAQGTYFATFPDGKDAVTVKFLTRDWDEYHGFWGPDGQYVDTTPGVEGIETIEVTLLPGPGVTPVGSPGVTIDMYDNEVARVVKVRDLRTAHSGGAGYRDEDDPSPVGIVVGPAVPPSSTVTIKATTPFLVGGATEGVDYTWSKTYHADPGGHNDYYTYWFTAVDDSDRETREVANLIVPPVHAFNTMAGEFWIHDDDETTAEVTVLAGAADRTAAELTQSKGVFRVERDPAAPGLDKALEVFYTVATTPDDGLGPDHGPVAGVVTIPAGQWWAPVVLTAFDDSHLEGQEKVRLTVVRHPTDPHRYKVGGDPAVIALVDDDSHVVASDTDLRAGTPFTATALGAGAEVVLATFTDADPSRTAAHYAATADWGDGTPPEAVTVVKEWDEYRVLGAHAYAESGSRAVVVTVTANYHHIPYDTSPQSEIVYSRSVETRVSATVHAAPVTLTPTTFEVNANTCSTADPPPDPDVLPDGSWVVARFTSSYTDATTRYRATVDSGDGSGRREATIQPEPAPGSGYRVVVPGYLFTFAGTYSLNITLFDALSNLGGGGAVAGTARATAYALGQPPGNAPDLVGAPFDAVEQAFVDGPTGEGQVVGYLKLPAGADPEDYEAEIDWGDGTDPDGADVVASAAGPPGYDYAVRSREPFHAYADPGVYGVKVTVTPREGAPLTAGTTATVDDLPVAGDGAAELRVPVGGDRQPDGSGAPVRVAAADARVVAVTNDDPTDRGDGYEAFVSWGDGTTSVVPVRGSGAGYWLEANHPYSHPGRYAVTARLLQDGSPGVPWEVSAVVEVVGTSEGGPYPGRDVSVVRVEHAYSPWRTDDVRAWVRWDGATDEGGLTPIALAAVGKTKHDQIEGVDATTAVNKGNVSAYLYVVTAPDLEGYFENPGDAAPWAEVVTGGRAGASAWDVAAADATFAADEAFEGAFPWTAIPESLGPPVRTARVGVATGALVTFRFLDADPEFWPAGANPAPPATRYGATVDWGDGSADSAGTVERVGDGLYRVTAPGHTYDAAGRYEITTFVRDLEAAAGESGARAAYAHPIAVEPAAELTAYQRRDERDGATWIPAGHLGEVSANTGAVRVRHPLDFDISPGTDVARSPHLVYNADTVAPRPVIEARLALPADATSVEAELTWDGAPQGPQTFPVGTAAGREVVLALRPASPVAATGLYEWTLAVTVHRTGGTTNLSRTDTAQVVVNDASPFGAGWWIDELWRVVPVAGGALVVYGTGESRFFERRGLGFVSPPEDPGVLRQVCGKYVYTSKHDEEWHFDAAGRMTQLLDRHRQEVLAFDYDGAQRLSQVTARDGNVVAVEYDVEVDGPDPYAVAFRESGGRSVGLGHAGTNVDEIRNPDGTRRYFAYTGAGLTSDTWGERVTAYRYDGTDLGSGFELGQGFGSEYGLTPAARRGLKPLAGGALPVVTAFEAAAGAVRPKALAGEVNDPRAHLTSTVVDPLGRAEWVKTADAERQRFDRDGAGRVVVFTDPRGYQTRTKYDAKGNVRRVEYPDGGHEAFTHHPAFSLVTTAADSYDHTTRTRYSDKGDVLWVEDPLRAGEGAPAQTSFGYHSGGQAGLVAWEEDARGNKSEFYYDAYRRPMEFLDALSGNTAFTYDAAGNPDLEIRQASAKTRTEYDALNRLTKQYDSYDVAVGVWKYDETGLVARSTDARGMVTDTDYDARGLAGTVTEGVGTALARTTTFDYDEAGNRIEAVFRRAYDGKTLPGEPATRTVTTDYDAMDRPTLTTDASGHALARGTHRTYDAAGNLASVKASPSYDAEIAALPEAWRPGLYATDVFTHDRMNRVEDATLGVSPGQAGFMEASAGRTTRTLYDLNGQAVIVIDPLGRLTWTDYDELGRVAKVTEAAGTRDERVTRTGYDAVGNVARETDGMGRVTEYAYDALNRRASVTEAVGTPLRRTTEFGYDARGNVEFEHRPRTYDEYDWLTLSFTREVVTTKYEYDLNDRRTKATEAYNLTPATWTPTAGSEMTALLPHAKPTTEYAYTTAGDLELVTDPLGRHTKTYFDIYGRPTEELAGWQFGTGLDAAYLTGTGWTYDAADNVRTETADGYAALFDAGSFRSVTHEYGYDALDRRTKVTLGAARVGGEPFGPGGPPVSESAYDAAGRPRWEADPNGVTAVYTYTPHGEVRTRTEAAMTPAARVTAFGYDAAGRVEAEHRTGKDQAHQATFGYDDLDRLVAVTESTNGAKVAAPARTTRHEYDLADNKTATTDPIGRRTEFGYDALDRPTATTEGYVAPTLAGGSAPWYLGAGGWLTPAHFVRTTTAGYDPADNLTWEAHPRAYLAQAGPPDDRSVVKVAAVTRHAYDGLNRLTLTVAAANATAADLGGHAPPVSRWQYDVAGRVVLELSPGRIDAPGQAHATTTEYDDADRPTVVSEGRYTFGTTPPAVPFTSLRHEDREYDGLGNLTKHTTGLSDTPTILNRQRIVAQTYDPLGRPVVTREEIDYVGNALVTVRARDKAGNVVAEVQQAAVAASDPGVRSTRSEFDELNRLTKKTEAADVDAPFKALFAGLSVVPRDPPALPVLGHAPPVWGYEYDGFDNVVKVTDPRTVASEFAFDGYGRRRTQTLATAWNTADPTVRGFGHAAPITKWDYDAADQLVTATDPLGVATDTRYDPLGRPVLTTEAFGTPAQRSAAASYDPGDRPTLVAPGLSPAAVLSLWWPWRPALATPATRTDYDPLGRPSKTTGAAQLTPAAAQAAFGPGRPWAESRHDAAGNVVKVTTNVSTPADARASVTRLEYDDLFRRVRATEGESATEPVGQADARVTTAAYDSSGNVVESVGPTGVTTATIYDLRSRPTLVR